MTRNGIMIYFDIDDTLYDVSGPFKEAFRETYPGYGHIEMEELFTRFRKHCDVLFFEHEKKTITRQQMYVMRIQDTLKEYGIVMGYDEAMAFQDLYQAKQLQIKMPSEIEEILDMLKNKGIRLGIISNGPNEHQWDKVRSLAALKWIAEEDVIISGEVGVAKPDLQIFEIAKERSGLDEEDLWYVGDSFGNDIVPAVKSGWHTVWFNHRRKEKDSGISPEKTVHSVRELREVLDEI